MWFSFLHGNVGHPSKRGEGAEVGNRVQKAVDMMGIALWELTSVGQLNFLLEYRKYMGLGSLGANPNLH